MVLCKYRDSQICTDFTVTQLGVNHSIKIHDKGISITITYKNAKHSINNKYPLRQHSIKYIIIHKLVIQHGWLSMSNSIKDYFNAVCEAHRRIDIVQNAIGDESISELWRKFSRGQSPKPIRADVLYGLGVVASETYRPFDDRWRVAPQSE